MRGGGDKGGNEEGGRRRYKEGGDGGRWAGMGIGGEGMESSIG